MRTVFHHATTLLSTACAVLIATFCVTAGAQEVVAAKANVSASSTASLKKYTEKGSDPWYEVLAKDTYSASATFTLDATPEDWTELAQEITVTVGDIECSPEISMKANAKGGSAVLKEKDAEAKSSLTCTVKWSKKTITVSLSGSNYDWNNIFVNDLGGAFENDVDVFVDLGGVSAGITVPVKGKGTLKVKKVKIGKGEEAYVDEYELFSWSAKGSAKE